MTDPTTTDAGRRYAFAPHPEPIEDILYRMHIIFEEPDGRLWSSGTDVMAPSMDSAEEFAEGVPRPRGDEPAVSHPTSYLRPCSPPARG